MDRLAQFIQTITRRAGSVVLRHFGRARVRYTKHNVADVVTQVDLAANRLLVTAIRLRYPTHGIISEEQGEHHPDAEYVWIIDPLDGTRNFSTGTPLFGVIVALARRRELQLAAIAVPFERRLYFARRGRGAFCNGRRIRCSGTRRWAYSYGSCGSSLRPDQVAPLVRLIRSAAEQPFWLSMFGAAAVVATYVADGRRDWLVSFGGGIWDYAGSALLMREAGCAVTNLQGRPWTLRDTTLVAATPALHRKLLAVVGPSRH